MLDLRFDVISRSKLSFAPITDSSLLYHSLSLSLCHLALPIGLVFSDVDFKFEGIGIKVLLFKWNGETPPPTPPSVHHAAPARAAAFELPMGCSRAGERCDTSVRTLPPSAPTVATRRAMPSRRAEFAVAIVRVHKHKQPWRRMRTSVRDMPSMEPGLSAMMFQAGHAVMFVVSRETEE